ncbi:MAG: hypothetical protein R3D85_03015 [Paracoccaceae bacterium]
MNFYAVGFVAVLGVVGLGVDYQQQSVNAGVGLGELSLGDYVATYSARYNGMQAEKAAEKAEDARRAAWREGPKPFLPEAPAGWTRRAFDAGDNSPIIPFEHRKQGLHDPDGFNYLAGAIIAPGETLETIKPAAGIAKIMGQRSAADVMKEVAGRSWVYQRGDEMIFLEATKSNPKNLNSLAGNIAATLDASFQGLGGRARGYGVIGGVAFVEDLNDKGRPSNHYRTLRGTMGFGQEVHFRVHANASAASTREVLQAIDFDGLNALLKTPMANVGNGITPPPGVDEAELAEKMEDLRSEFQTLLAAEAQYRVQNMNAGALMINTLAQGYGAGGGLVDLTGGQAVSMETLIYAGYRQGMRDLMAGRDGDLAMNEIGVALKSAMLQDSAARRADAANAPAPVIPQMSAALAAELGVVIASENEDRANADIASGGTSKVSPEEARMRARKNALALGMSPAEADAAADQAVAMARMMQANEALSDAKTRAPSQPEQKAGGGWLGKIGSMFGGGSGSSEVASAKDSRESVEIRRMGGGGARLAGGGCGAGKFCEANTGD